VVFVFAAFGKPLAAMALTACYSGLTCSAKREGAEWVVTGNKKWITNGMYADIFITAVMTGTPGQNGMSVLLIPKDTAGFSVRKISIRGADLSGDFHFIYIRRLVSFVV
jgi:alkylation response protein AidB-like acyl-CoA dehydrogenase